MSQSIVLRGPAMVLGLAAMALYAAPQGEFIYTSAPFPSAHASTVVELSNGELMAAWFGGTDEGKTDVAIWGSRRIAGKWSAPVEIVREPNIPTWNPVLFHTKDGRLWLYYKFGKEPESWTAGRLSSTDEGKTWSRPEHIPAGIYGPIRAKPLVLKDGTIVSGTSVESYRSWSVWIERSEDNGATWTKFGPITVPQAGKDPTRKSGLIQPSVVAMGGNKLRLYARSTTDIGRICIADSNDLGKTWTQARLTDLPNPNSGIDAVSLRDGRVVVIYNHTEKGRSPLNLAVSKDGEKFRMFQVLEDTAGGEFSYPNIIQGANGDLHMVYTWNRQRMKYVRLPLAEVPQ